jgi:uncharacterized membrane protein
MLPNTAATPIVYPRRLAWLVIIVGGLVLGLWLYGTPPGILGKADAIGYAICHRIPARSFHVHDRPLPLCARCTGIYLGVITGLLFFASKGRTRAQRLPDLKILGVLVVLGALYAVDGLNSYLSMFEAYTPVYQPHNTLRLITGTTFGLAMITVVLPVFNATAWRASDSRALLDSVRELVLLYGIAAGVVALVLLELPAVLVIAGLVSAAGVVLMFLLVGGLLFLIVTRRDNQLTHWRELWLPALAGFTFALLIIGGIDLARYAFTGTWDGFTLLG